MEAARTSRTGLSPRASRVLFWLGALVLAAGVTFFIVKLADRGGSSNPTPAASSSTPIKQPASGAGTAVAFKKIDPAARRVAGDFIMTAVARKHVAQSWQLTHSSLRAGYTKKQWKTGNIPVTPFPVNSLDQARFKVMYRLKREILLEVALVAPPHSNTDTTIFQLGLRKVGNGGSAHWTVDYWVPVWSPPVPFAPGARGQ
jgi:hypothetical protein